MMMLRKFMVFWNDYEIPDNGAGKWIKTNPETGNVRRSISTIRFTDCKAWLMCSP